MLLPMGLFVSSTMWFVSWSGNILHGDLVRTATMLTSTEAGTIA